MYYNQFQQRVEVVHVNGENGARAYQLPPNSSVLLLDDTAPIIWLCQTDGAGYKTATPYKIEPYVPSPPVDVINLESRITKLEAQLEERTGHGKSNAKNVETKQ